jgi:hypothetical protein
MPKGADYDYDVGGIMNGLPYSDHELVQRAMMNMANRSHADQFRWVIVRDTFGFGSTMAKVLCKRFGFNPDEILTGRKAEL